MCCMPRNSFLVAHQSFSLRNRLFSRILDAMLLSCVNCNAILPLFGSARSLLLICQVSSAAPVAAALASGTASEATLSYLYGGKAEDGVSELSMAIPVYEAIGRVSQTHPLSFCSSIVLCRAFQHVSMNFYIVCQSVLSEAGKICADAVLWQGNRQFETQIMMNVRHPHCTCQQSLQ